MTEYGTPTELSSSMPNQTSSPISLASRNQSENSLAEEWARSTGLVELPQKPHKFKVWICVVATIAFIPLGFVYYIWCQNQNNKYSQALATARRMWRTAGSPDPYLPMAAAQAPTKVDTLSEKLREMGDLKDKGLLSEDEFTAAKRKLLGI